MSFFSSFKWPEPQQPPPSSEEIKRINAKVAEQIKRDPSLRVQFLLIGAICVGILAFILTV